MEEMFDWSRIKPVRIGETKSIDNCCYKADSSKSKYFLISVCDSKYGYVRGISLNSDYGNSYHMKDAGFFNENGFFKKSKGFNKEYSFIGVFDEDGNIRELITDTLLKYVEDVDVCVYSSNNYKFGDCCYINADPIDPMFVLEYIDNLKNNGLVDKFEQYFSKRMEEAVIDVRKIFSDADQKIMEFRKRNK